MENPQQILQTFRSELSQAHGPAELRELRVKYLGKKSELKNALKNLREVPAEERAEEEREATGERVDVEPRVDELLLRLFP